MINPPVTYFLDLIRALRYTEAAARAVRQRQLGTMNWPDAGRGQPETVRRICPRHGDANHVMLGDSAKARGGIAEIFKIAR